MVCCAALVASPVLCVEPWLRDLAKLRPCLEKPWAVCPGETHCINAALRPYSFNTFMKREFSREFLYTQVLQPGIEEAAIPETLSSMAGSSEGNKAASLHHTSRISSQQRMPKSI